MLAVLVTLLSGLTDCVKEISGKAKITPSDRALAMRKDKEI
jgi:hypothetical protein